ncbi:MAG TPA: hypothetical protein VGM66_07185 [Candidatus Udaeobacter sp.]
MRELELEIASLSAIARSQRKPEFDSRLVALLQEQDNIALAATAFLGPTEYPNRGNA